MSTGSAELVELARRVTLTPACTTVRQRPETLFLLCPDLSKDCEPDHEDVQQDWPGS